jgi:hypothetical protein
MDVPHHRGTDDVEEHEEIEERVFHVRLPPDQKEQEKQVECDGQCPNEVDDGPPCMILTMNLPQIEEYVYQNRFPLSAASAAILTAFIKTAPLPGSPWNWTTLYAWVYDGLHQIFNIKNDRSTEKPTS